MAIFRKASNKHLMAHELEGQAIMYTNNHKTRVPSIATNKLIRQKMGHTKDLFDEVSSVTLYDLATKAIGTNTNSFESKLGGRS